MIVLSYSLKTFRQALTWTRIGIISRHLSQNLSCLKKFKSCFQLDCVLISMIQIGIYSKRTDMISPL